MSETNNLSNFTISTGKIDSLLIFAYPAPKSSIAIENLLALSFNNVQQLQTEYKSLLDNYKKLFKQSKRLIRMSD